MRERTPLLSSRKDLVKGSRANHDHVHEVTFVIRQKNMDELTNILHDLSDPLSPNYGQHWSREAVTDFTGNPESCNATVTYLNSIGALMISESVGEYITANASIAVWEKMLNTQFFTFYQTKQDKRVTQMVRAEKYYIPIDLDSHVESAFNTIQMPIESRSSISETPKRNKKLPSAKDIASYTKIGSITPAKIMSYYNMSSTVKGSNFSTQAVYSSAAQYYSPSDLKAFQISYGITPQTAFSIGNHNNDTMCQYFPGNCAEGNSDIQYIMGISQGSPSTFWEIPYSFSYFLRTIASYANPPLVVSISYGFNEESVSKAEFNNFNSNAIKLAIIGVTIVVASGDSGAGYCAYTPVFPASSPYVTSVGATGVSIVHVLF